MSKRRTYRSPKAKIQDIQRTQQAEKKTSEILSSSHLVSSSLSPRCCHVNDSEELALLLLHSERWQDAGLQVLEIMLCRSSIHVYIIYTYVMCVTCDVQGIRTGRGGLPRGVPARKPQLSLFCSQLDQDGGAHDGGGLSRDSCGQTW